MLAAVAAAAVIHPLKAMRTPTGNISCFVAPGPPSTLHCGLQRADYAQRLQNDHCGPPIGVDWGGFELPARSRGAVTCTGGVLYDPATQRPHYVTVAYGHTWHAGPFDCHSQLDGLGCSNHTGHGFFISRQTWRVW